MLLCLGSTALERVGGRARGRSCRHAWTYAAGVLPAHVPCPPSRLVGLCWCNAGLGTGSAGRYSGLAWGSVPILPLLGFALLGCISRSCLFARGVFPGPAQCVPKVAGGFLCSTCLIGFCISCGVSVCGVHGSEGAAHWLQIVSGPQCHCQGLGVFVRGRLSTAPAVGVPLVSGDTGCDWRIVATCAMTQVVASLVAAERVLQLSLAVKRQVLAALFGSSCLLRRLLWAHQSARQLETCMACVAFWMLGGCLPAPAAAQHKKWCRGVASCRSFQPRQYHLRSVSSAARHSDCGSHQTGASAFLC